MAEIENVRQLINEGIDHIDASLEPAQETVTHFEAGQAYLMEAEEAFTTALTALENAKVAFDNADRTVHAAYYGLVHAKSAFESAAGDQLPSNDGARAMLQNLTPILKEFRGAKDAGQNGNLNATRMLAPDARIQNALGLTRAMLGQDAMPRVIGAARNYADNNGLYVKARAKEWLETL